MNDLQKAWDKFLVESFYSFPNDNAGSATWGGGRELSDPGRRGPPRAGREAPEGWDAHGRGDRLPPRL